MIANKGNNSQLINAPNPVIEPIFPDFVAKRTVVRDIKFQVLVHGSNKTDVQPNLLRILILRPKTQQGSIQLLGEALKREWNSAISRLDYEILYDKLTWCTEIASINELLTLKNCDAAMTSERNFHLIITSNSIDAYKCIYIYDCILETRNT